MGLEKDHDQDQENQEDLVDKFYYYVIIMKELLLKIITFAHVLFVLFVILVPFIGNNYFLLLHSIFIPFIILHWICNDNTCVLTVIEKKLRKDLNKDEGDCITCQLIEPVYDFRKNYTKFSVIIYLIAIFLWCISAGKLFYKFKTGQVTSFLDLMK